MVYDCFTFFNELDLLEIRLNELDSVVDKFVLVEATKTFTGTKKELFFQNNKSRFKKFLPKIIHVIVDDLDKAPDIRLLPNYLKIESVELNPKIWSREAYQRNAIIRGLEQAKPKDLILISDIDEIPNKDKISNIKFSNQPKILGFEQDFFYYYLNSISNEKWYGTKCIFKKYLTSPQEIRTTKKYKTISNGGWHFSCLGGVEEIQNKLNSFSHQEYNTKEYTDFSRLKFNIFNNFDILNRPVLYKIVNIDKNFPLYLQKNIGKYRRYIKKIVLFDKNTKELQQEVNDLRKKIYETNLKHTLDMAKIQNKLSEITNSRTYRLSKKLSNLLHVF